LYEYAVRLDHPLIRIAIGCGGSGASGFDSGTIKPGARATVTFRQAGTYAHICQFHAFMHGTVVIK
jgi:plastocyanin